MKTLNFTVIVGYNKETHLPIEMEIKDIIKKYPKIKTIEDLNEVLQDNSNTLFEDKTNPLKVTGRSYATGGSINEIIKLNAYSKKNPFDLYENSTPAKLKQITAEIKKGIISGRINRFNIDSVISPLNKWRDHGAIDTPVIERIDKILNEIQELDKKHRRLKQKLKTAKSKKKGTYEEGGSVTGLEIKENKLLLEKIQSTLNQWCRTFVVIGTYEETPRYSQLDNRDGKFRLQSTQIQLYYNIHGLTDEENLFLERIQRFKLNSSRSLWNQYKEIRTEFLVKHYPTIDIY